MEISVRDLAARVDGHLAAESDGAEAIRGIAVISEAGEGDLTFFSNAKYLGALKKCAATAALVPLDFSETILPIAIRVASPSLAWAQVTEEFKPAPLRFAPGVHPTAIVGEGATLDEGASVQPYAVIEPGARIGARAVIGAYAYVGHEAQIGADCLLHPRVTVGSRCLVGNRVILHSGVVLGSDGFGFELVNGRHVKIAQLGIVQIDDDVEIGANSTIDRARLGRTWIQEGTKIDNLVQIAHNVVVGKHCILVAQVGVSGSTRLGNFVTLAGQVGVVGHIEIGDQATVGAQSGVSKSLAAKGVYMGSPAIDAKEWREQIALVHRLDRVLARLRKLEQFNPSLAQT
ncbi:MAG TPA: UDP-3-O-(3-hydroxymyristoyl)glucosamine N-acyltransferase [Chthoniobacteraceae bacterium]